MVAALCMLVSCQPPPPDAPPSGAISASINSEAAQRRVLTDRIEKTNAAMGAAGTQLRNIVAAAPNEKKPDGMWPLLATLDKGSETIATAVLDLRESHKKDPAWEKATKDYERKLAARETALAAKSAESLGHLQDDMRWVFLLALAVAIVGAIVWWKVGKGAGMPVVGGACIAGATAIAVITDGDRIGNYSAYGLMASVLCVLGGLFWSAYKGKKTEPDADATVAFYGRAMAAVGGPSAVDQLVAGDESAVRFVELARALAAAAAKKGARNEPDAGRN